MKLLHLLIYSSLEGGDDEDEEDKEDTDDMISKYYCSSPDGTLVYL